MALWFQRGTLPDDADVRDSSRLQCVLHIERDDPGQAMPMEGRLTRCQATRQKPGLDDDAISAASISASSISASFIAGSARQQQ